jgi:H+/Cl- antiporter ClcA
MTKIYLLSKSIHRILLLIILFIGLFMSVTGILLKYTFLATKFSFIDLGQVRYIHNNLSPVFSILFFMMALTGIIMYIFPLTRNK